MMDIREATENDLDSLNGVIRRAVMDWEIPERVKRLSLPSLQYDELDLEHFVILVAETDSRITGVAALDTAPRNVGEQISALLLHGIYVDPAHQREGIGRKLLSAMEEIVLQKDAGALLVKAQKDAEGFYHSMGLHKLENDRSGNGYALRYWKTVERSQ
jgi:N-acetylglutamate synthase-like GNAT family acetyltransferase